MMKTIQRTLVTLAAAGAAMLGMAGPAHAGVLVSSAQDCDDSAASRVFLPWLDVANYVPAPDGSAESAASWDLGGGARIVPGNEPWKVGDKADASSLQLPNGSTATTGVMC